MRLGNRSPLDARDTTDLGRFGLGLKTASFSQGRRLTVVTKRDRQIASARWDLDEVAKVDDWVVEIPETPLELPWADHLGESGTLVLWEKLDRIAARALGEAEESHLVHRLSDAARHLELVFHRFLLGERGLKRISISLNGRPLEPFDPFHTSHSATIVGPQETIRIGQHSVLIQAFTLPHHKKVTPAEWGRYSGPGGYLRNQGFYVYRNRRLIIHGTWFGLARQVELTKLARVRIDMPTGLDAEWKIDIKKASAQPPPQVRDRLRRLIETIGANSKRAYTVRGQKLVTESRLPVWQRQQDKNEITYRINLEHPAVVDFVDRLPVDLRNDFNRIVEMVGAAVPIDALFADISGDPTRVVANAMSPEALHHVVTATCRQLHRLGVSSGEIATILKSTEPFRSNCDLTESLVAAWAQEEAAGV